MLQGDRLVKIYVAQNNTSYLVPGTILTSIFEYFVKALAYEGRLGGEENGVLRFPEDDQTAWVRPSLAFDASISSYEDIAWLWATLFLTQS